MSACRLQRLSHQANRSGSPDQGGGPSNTIAELGCEVGGYSPLETGSRSFASSTSPSTSGSTEGQYRISRLDDGLLSSVAAGEGTWTGRGIADRRSDRTGSPGAPPA